VLAGFAQKGQEAEIFEPVVIIDQLRRIGPAVEIQETRQLLPDADLVVTQRFFRQEFTFRRFARRITDHAGSATTRAKGL
jgi:hypothetical protein